MIIVSGARRTGTSLAMQVLERCGLSCFSEQSIMDERLPERNEFGYRDSSSYIKSNRRLPSEFDAIKLFHFDLALLEGFQHKDHEYLITLRHPQFSVASVRAVVDLTNGNESVSKSLRMYIDSYEYLLKHVIQANCKFAVVDFEGYPEVAHFYQTIVPSASDDIVAGVWSGRSAHFSESAGDFDRSFIKSSAELYDRATELYESLRRAKVAYHMVQRHPQ